MIRRNTNRIGCAPGASCCASCQSHRLGDASSDFQDFLDANPSDASAVAAWQASNESDPVLQPLAYNPLTNVYGPVSSAPSTALSPAEQSLVNSIPTGPGNTWGILALGVGLIATVWVAGRK